jgi:hypothetical protein
VGVQANEQKKANEENTSRLLMVEARTMSHMDQMHQPDAILEKLVNERELGWKASPHPMS